MEAKVKKTAAKKPAAKPEVKAPAAPAKETKKPAPKKKAAAKVDPVKELMFKLKKIRLDRGLTAKELAEKAGISDSTIHAYERGDSIPKLATFIKIVDALGYKIVLVMK